MRALKYYVEKKHYLRRKNMVNENKVLSYCGAFRGETKKMFSFSNLQTYYYFKLSF